MALEAAGMYSRVRRLLPELVKFGVVGGLGSIVDLGGAAVLHSKYHVGPLGAKALSVTVACVITYLGSRFWTFKHRENQSMGREAVLFIVLNLAGLIIAEAVLGLVVYVMGLRGALEYNAASVLGTGLGTIFRFYAYRKWVFLDPSGAPGLVAAAARVTAPQRFLDYAPWELDPAYLAPARAYSGRHEDVERSSARERAVSREAVSREAVSREAVAWDRAPDWAEWQPADGRSTLLASDYALEEDGSGFTESAFRGRHRRE